jgi:MFS transporter, DHA2 family, multidrug resistance protein
VKPAYLISGGLAFGSIGLFVLTQVPTSDGLVPLVVASVIISLGLAPVFGLTTELIVGSAPPERAGAASGISETGAELGGALGLALLGTIGVAIYRGALNPSVLSALPPDVANAARGTLGGAVGVAGALPADTAETLLAVARAAFTDGMHVAAAIAGVVGLGLAAFAFVTLRDRGTERAATEPTCVEPTMIDQPVLVPVGKPARECF